MAKQVLFKQIQIKVKAVQRISTNSKVNSVDTVKNIGTVNLKLKNELVFNNASLVFGHRTTSELIRGFLVLQACSFDSLVDKSSELMKKCERIFGSQALGLVIAPFYNQFVAGNSKESFRVISKTFTSVGINLMVCPTLETDVGESTDESVMFEKNFQKTLNLIKLSSMYRPSSNCRPICQTKITAHISATSLLNISTRYESINEKEREETITEVSEAMKNLSLGAVSQAMILNFKHLDIATEDLENFKDALPRLYTLGKCCKEKNVILTVDAEYSYINPAINLITLALMKTFNTHQPVIWNTYQGYLKNSKYWLQHDYHMAKCLGRKFGAKIVRGAYMEKERANASSLGIPDPVHDTYEDTNESYNSLLGFIVPIVATSSNSCQIMAATHNEASVVHACNLLSEHGIASEDPKFVFAQIYGMAENISVTLAKHGFNVYKSVPYGSVNETLPYLSRRANENRAVFKGARQEKQLLAAEIKSRLLLTKYIRNK